MGVEGHWGSDGVGVESVGVGVCAAGAEGYSVVLLADLVAYVFVVGAGEVKERGL